MGIQSSFHAPQGNGHFLGFRQRAGKTEIIYDDGDHRRMIWQVAVASRADETHLSEALALAVGALHVVPTLYTELKKRAIVIEHIAG